MKSEIQLIQVQKDKVHLLADMARIIWPKAYGHIISAQQIDYMIDRFYGEQKIREVLSSGHDVQFIETRQEKIGYIHVESRSSEYFIHKFYLLPDTQHMGYGSHVIGLLENVYKGKPFRLQVNRFNILAINFYFKNGFHIESAQDFDIGEGFYMNDYIMLKA